MDRINERVISIRQQIHQNPELGLKEHQTAALVAKVLNDLGLEVIEGIGQTGVVGLLHGTKPSNKPTKKTVMLRADMDALNMQETNDVPYKSKKTKALCTPVDTTHILHGSLEPQ